MDKYLMKNLFNEGKFDEILTLYDADNSSFSEWDYFYTVGALFKKKFYDKCVMCYNEMNSKYPNFNNAIANDRMGWSLYYLYIKELTSDSPVSDDTFRALDWIYRNSSNNDKSPRWRSLEKYCKSKGNNADFINKFLDTIDVKTLSDEAKEYTIRGREGEYASDKENWYKFKSKALFDLKQYAACIDVINKSFEDVKEFHSNNDIWLKIRIVDCLLCLNDVNEAFKVICETYEESKKRNYKHWCIYERSCYVNSMKSDKDAALKYGAECALADSSHQMRVSFYLKFAEYLQSIGMGREASLHCRLVQIIREEEKWGPAQMPVGISIKDEISSMDKNSVLKELNEFWYNEKDRGKEYRTGVVKRILPNGYSGFITDDSANVDYYFSTKDFVNRNERDLVKEGVSLKYTLEEKLDKSKGVMKLNAVDISIVR